MEQGVTEPSTDSSILDQEYVSCKKEKLTLTELREVFEKITEEISCPICLNLLHAPVAVCVNGHGTCPDCRARTTLCSICNESFQSIRVRPLDDILSIIPHRCKFEGCEEVVRAADDHEEFCGYRLTDCMTCEWKGCVKDIIEHIKSELKPSEIFHQTNIGYTLRNVKKPDRKTVFFIPMIAYGQFFWLNFIIYPDEKESRMTITYVPQIKLQCLLKIKLSLVLEQKMYEVSSMMSFNDLTGNQDNFLSLPSSIIQRFLDTDNDLNFNLSIETTSLPE